MWRCTLVLLLGCATINNDMFLMNLLDHFFPEILLFVQNSSGTTYPSLILKNKGYFYTFSSVSTLYSVPK